MAYQQPPGYTPYAAGQQGYPPPQQGYAPQQGYQPGPNYAPPAVQQQAHTNVVVVQQQPAQRVNYIMTASYTFHWVCLYYIIALLSGVRIKISWYSILYIVSVENGDLQFTQQQYRRCGINCCSRCHVSTVTVCVP